MIYELIFIILFYQLTANKNVKLLRILTAEKQLLVRFYKWLFKKLATFKRYKFHFCAIASALNFQLIVKREIHDKTGLSGNWKIRKCWKWIEINLMWILWFIYISYHRLSLSTQDPSKIKKWNKWSCPPVEVYTGIFVHVSLHKLYNLKTIYSDSKQQ